MASDQVLVAESVCFALTHAGFEARVLPEITGGPAGRSAIEPADAGLLVWELDSLAQVHAACAAVQRLPRRCLLLTGSAPGAAWQSLREAGVETVLPSSAGLVEVIALLRRAHESRTP